MQLRESQWIVRVYRWTLWQRAYFRKEPIDHFLFDNFVTTNVCHFVRTLTLTLGLLIGGHLLLLWVLVYVLIIWPVRTMGWHNYLVTTVTFYGLVGLCSGLAVLLYLAIRWGVEASKHRALPQLAPVRQRRPPGVLKLAKQWFRDKHNKVCTIVKID